MRIGDGLARVVERFQGDAVDGMVLKGLEVL